MAYETILGIDPGFSAVGYALARFRPNEEQPEILSLGVIRTAKWKPRKGTKQKKPSASEDNVDRAIEIYKRLNDFSRPPTAICVEAMSFPRSSSVAAKMAMCWGVIAALSVAWDAPIFQVSPKAMKKAVTGRPDAEKEEVQGALQTRYGGKLLREKLERVPKSFREHPYDALGVLTACLQDPQVAALNRRPEYL